jgi:hypothetical protein
MLQAFLGAEGAAGEPGDEARLLRALRQTLAVEPSPHEPSDQSDPRTLLEAGCFYARRMLESVRAAGSGRGRLFSVGGWARSKALLQLRASVLDEPLFTLDEEELTALGAALIAREAAMPDESNALRRDERVRLSERNMAITLRTDVSGRTRSVEGLERRLSVALNHRRVRTMAKHQCWWWAALDLTAGQRTMRISSAFPMAPNISGPAAMAVRLSVTYSPCARSHAP